MPQTTMDQATCTVVLYFGLLMSSISGVPTNAPTSAVSDSAEELLTWGASETIKITSAMPIAVNGSTLTSIEDNSTSTAGAIPYTPGASEGDIMVDNGEPEPSAESHARRKRKVSRNRWENGIVPYVIDDASYQGATKDYRSLIMNAMKEWEDHTCINFIPRQASHKFYIRFASGRGCQSFIGRISRSIPDGQTVTLDKNSCLYNSVIIHEIGHALGLLHEQSRADRDQFVTVVPENVHERFLSNYNMADNQRLYDEVPYDYTSAMHYSQTTFSKSDSGPSLLTKDPLYQKVIGSEDHLTLYDYMAVNLDYKCAGSCATSFKCENGGHVRKEGSRCICVCPDGLTGSRCEKVEATGCGGVIRLTAGRTETLVPNPDSKCIWLIKGSAGALMATVEDLNLRCDTYASYRRVRDGQGRHGYLEVRRGKLGQGGGLLCGSTKRIDMDAYAHSDTMMIISDTRTRRETTAAFKLKVKLMEDGCHTITCQNDGVCQSMGPRSFQCICYPGFSGTYCEKLNTAAFDCDFDVPCPFFESVKNLDFRIDRTFSENRFGKPVTPFKRFMMVGISNYAGRNSMGRYMTIGSSDATDGVDRCLTFHYYLGANDPYKSKLEVVVDNNGQDASLWSIEQDGSPQNRWVRKEVDIPAGTQKLGFQWKTDPYRSSDEVKAVGSITLAATPCARPCATQCQNGGSCFKVSGQEGCNCRHGFSGDRCQSMDLDQICSFDNGLCGMKNGQTREQWKFHEGIAHDKGMTGPLAGEGDRGAYLLLESASGSSPGRVVDIETPALGCRGQAVLEFDYYMMGAGINSFSVLLRRPGLKSSDSSLFKRDGGQGSRWNHARVDVASAAEDSTIVFSGTMGGKYSSLAIDNVIVRRGSCVGGGGGSRPIPQPQPTRPTVGVITTLAPTASSTMSTPSGDFQCSFESSTCNFREDSGVWTRTNRPTTSTGTGPSAAASGQYYTYFETSNPVVAGALATISTPVAPRSSSYAYCVEFQYHMFGGSSMGALRVGTMQGTRRTDLFTKNGDQGNQWHQGVIQLSNVGANVRVFFEAEKGISFKSDIGLDEVKISRGRCARTPTNPITPTVSTPPPQPPTSSSIRCSFESSLCGFTDDNSRTWTRKEGPTGSSGTGPDRAGTGKFYLYFETSNPAVSGEMTKISAPIRASSAYCAEFMYHMYGSTMGTLNFGTERGSTKTVLFTRSGDQGTTWRSVRVQIPTVNSGVRVYFEAVKGISFKSDIAIDDIKIVPGRCSGGSLPTSTTTTTTTTMAPATIPPTGGNIALSCSFERDMCSFRQETSDDHDWTRKQGTTPSSGTGPLVAADGQFFVFLESSSPVKDTEKARISAPIMARSGNNAYCAMFKYHMHGSTMGILRFGTETGARRTPLFTMSGEKGDQWIMARVQLSNIPDNTNVYFEAERGTSYKSDMAVDNVMIVQGACAGASLPTTPAPNYNTACGFEQNSLCSFKQSQPSPTPYRFAVHSGTTPTSGTGPQSARFGSSYIYASGTLGSAGDATRLELGTLPPTVEKLTVEVTWNMRGSGSGELNLLIVHTGGSVSNVWSKKGDQGDRWHQTTITVTVRGRDNYTMVLEAKRGPNEVGDIALDEVILRTE